MKRSFTVLVICFWCQLVVSQKTEYATSLIVDSLKQNANAVVRLHQLDVLLISQREMKVHTLRIVTVLNEKGLSAIQAMENYNKTTTVTSIKAIVYNSFGKELKRCKQKDFYDQTAVGGSTIFSESRFVMLNYTPTEYPFTVVYESELATSNTAFIPQWHPLNAIFVSVEKSILNVTFPNDLGFKKKEINLDHFPIKKTKENQTFLSYEANGLTALRDEELASFDHYFPKVMMGLEHFHLEGFDGTATNWLDFGKWYATKILNGTIDLSDQAIAKAKSLVGAETDPIKKAKILYQYLQDKVRYVSIQVGIGGWKPMQANDVDKLGYGDCKALSNYTKALLQAVGVPSYTTILYGNPSKMNIQNDFVSMQGNHMILCVPNEGQNLFLECTSQKNPFGYQANFTDDRDVLIIKPEGGEIVHTKKYLNNDNEISTKATLTLSETGDLSVNVSMTSEGAKYDERAQLADKMPDEQEKWYKEYWDNINNLKVHKNTLSIDKEKIQCIENVMLSAKNYGVFSGDSMLVSLNPIDQYSINLKRNKNRKTPFELSRGAFYKDEITLVLPQGFEIKALPESLALASKFGDYKTEIIKKDAFTVVYKRSFLIKKGLYSNTEFEDFRNYLEHVAKNDNAKLLLIKKNN